VSSVHLPGCLIVATPLFAGGLGCMLRMHWRVRLCLPEEQALRAGLARRAPDLAIVDLVINQNGMEAAQIIRNAHPDLPLFGITLGDEVPSWMQTLDLSWSGSHFLAKMRGIRESMIRTDSEGPAQTELQTSLRPHDVSQRERQVVQLLDRGFGMKEVARLLGITPRTVAFHKYNLMRKYDLRTNRDFLTFAHTVAIDTDSADE